MENINPENLQEEVQTDVSEIEAKPVAEAVSDVNNEQIQLLPIRLVKIILAVTLSLMALIFIVSLIIKRPTTDNIINQQKPTPIVKVTPKPTVPEKTDEEISEIDKKLKALEEKVKKMDLTEPNLSYPQLEMNVKFEEKQ